jgi:hypothetical protein
MAVNQNLKESLPTSYDNILGAGYPDLKYHGELVNFGKRIARKLANAPDVLILQEVLRSTEDITATDLTKALGYHYVSFVKPGAQNLNDIISPDHTQMIKWNTGIIINAQTMAPTSNSGYATYMQTVDQEMSKCPTPTPPHPPCVQGVKLAWGEVSEKSTGNKVAMFDIHFLPNQKFSSRVAGNTARTDWSKSIVQFVSTQMPDAKVRLIAGEFDQSRCRGSETPTCTAKPFYRAFVHSGYIDGVVANNPTQSQLTAATGDRIDFAFTYPKVPQDTRDMAYTIMDQKHGGNPGYISDHRMEWWTARG